MGGSRIESAWDFARHMVDVAARCVGCGRAWRMTSDELMSAVGGETSIATAQRQLKCSECGHVGVKLAALPRMRD